VTGPRLDGLRRSQGGLNGLRRAQAELHRLDRLAGAMSGAIEAALSAGEQTIADADRLMQRLEHRLGRLPGPQVAQPGLEPEPRPPRPHLIDLALALVGPGDHLVDVGAGGGDLAFAVAARGCATLAIEASPANAAALADRRWRTGFHDLHLVVADYGVARVDDLLVAFEWATAALVRLDEDELRERYLVNPMLTYMAKVKLGDPLKNRKKPG